jgi:hypothetical protein
MQMKKAILRATLATFIYERALASGSQHHRMMSLGFDGFPSLSAALGATVPMCGWSIATPEV